MIKDCLIDVPLDHLEVCPECERVYKFKVLCFTCQKGTEEDGPDFPFMETENLLNYLRRKYVSD